MRQRLLPMEAHPLWGTGLRFLPGAFDDLVAAQVVAAERPWRSATRLGRRTAAYARSADILDAISYYDKDLQLAGGSEAPLFAVADHLLDQWLPPEQVRRQPNYMLANLYSEPLACARWHQDVPEAIEDWILSVSLGAERLFLLQSLGSEAADVYFLRLPSNSALLMGPGINSTHRHCVPPCTHEMDEGHSSADTSLKLPPCPFTGPRINLTFRCILEFP